MARHKSSKGITPKTEAKLKQIITQMIAGQKPRDELIWSELGGFSLKNAVATGYMRWDAKMKCSSECYRTVLERLKASGHDIQYFERSAIRALVQTAVMKAFRHIESSQSIPWDAIDADVRMYNSIKFGLPSDMIDTIMEVAKMYVEEYGKLVMQAEQVGVYAKVNIAPAPEEVGE